ncbi:hypothetical protein TrLO_g10494 [Triparma laevis f. longispina]|uniref:Uncharacterized protein n=1 Tax=Triparma laevis f. longispina TaxID=1714387 RepID=A0A9W7FNK5_9STRA|nr:hypothetical protein TrLO_g10494 [Triparma laevis f. longispina]
MAFSTFFQTSYGDDKTRWLIADKSIDYDSSFHKKFKFASYAAILIYPVGIPALYTYELFKHREAIKDFENRRTNDRIKHIAFLWRDYRPQYWWFEIYECFRRLSLTGMLVYFETGSVLQLCFSIILAILSLQVYTECKPFEKPSENDLVKVSSLSIILTLIAVIMFKLRSKDITESSNQIGIVLIIVNSLVFVILGLGIFIPSLLKFFNKFNTKNHNHDGPLKEMGPECEDSVEAFIDHFKRLVDSDKEEAGWVDFNTRDWHINSITADEWMEKTGAHMQWRCTYGSGPANQARLKFTVDLDINTVVSHNDEEGHKMTSGQAYTLRKGENWREVYQSYVFPWPLRERDGIYMEYTRKELDGSHIIASRSSKELSEATNSLSVKAGRMRQNLILGGLHFRPLHNGKTEITSVIQTELGGVLDAFDYYKRRVALTYMKEQVDKHYRIAHRAAPRRSASISTTEFKDKSSSKASAALNIELGYMIRTSAGTFEGDKQETVFVMENPMTVRKEEQIL